VRESLKKWLPAAEETIHHHVEFVVFELSYSRFKQMYMYSTAAERGCRIDYTAACSCCSRDSEKKKKKK
jgi:hypothetical protein